MQVPGININCDNGDDDVDNGEGCISDMGAIKDRAEDLKAWVWLPMTRVPMKTAGVQAVPMVTRCGRGAVHCAETHLRGV